MLLGTIYGRFLQDKSGAYHYAYAQAVGYVDDAARDALRFRPTAPAWFWFNGTPAPIYPLDTCEKLVRRWIEWREAYQREGGHGLLRCLEELSKSAV